MPDTTLMALKAAGARVRAEGSLIEAGVDTAILKRCALVLRDAGMYPVFMTAVHTEAGFMLCYQFALWDSPCRVLVSTPAKNDGRAVSLTPLFPGLQWHEREARDMFGIIFENHPDLRPLLLCDEDRDLQPLRKDPARLKTPEQLTRAEHTDPDEQAP